jgi:hypothetical protein
MSNPSTPPALRERASEDPWTIVLRVVHDLRRDGIRADAPTHRMPAAVRHAARLLEVLGVHAEAPDEEDGGGQAPLPYRINWRTMVSSRPANPQVGTEVTRP